MRAQTPTVPVTAAPDPDAPLATQLLLGETFDVYEVEEGWAWGQGADGYVGYAPDACLVAAGDAPTHRICAPQALIYPEPAIRARPFAAAPLGAQLRLAPCDVEGWAALEDGGFLPAPHVAPRDAPEPDWVAVAERLIGAPYLWGGRSAAGIDCSGLVQVARNAAGFDCLRDSDMQEAAAGETVSALRRGDLIFWAGHVGIMISETRILHANAHHMAVAAEPLDEAVTRIAAKSFGAVTARRRWIA